MLWGKKLLRVAAALAVAFAAAHTAERLKAPANQKSMLETAAELAREGRTTVPEQDTAVPKSASLRSAGTTGMGPLIGITSVAASTAGSAADSCKPTLSLKAAAGAMIDLTLVAPCNRGQRFVVRHSGLAFSGQTKSDGLATLTFPALKSDAMVTVYLKDSRVVLGKVAVADAANYARFAIVWELPTELELRVTDGEKVLVGTTTPSLGEEQRVMALGLSSVQSPVLARVYSVPGSTLGEADITAELRITPASCGRTLRVETVHALAGLVVPSERSIAVPLCGTSGDILVLKNLAPDPKLAAPK